MAECAGHPGREAVGGCAGCGRPVCEECAEVSGETGVYCYDCAVRGQLAVMAEKEKAEAARPAHGGVRQKRFSRWMVVSLAVMALLIAAEVTYIVISRSGRKPPARVSAAQKAVYERDRCAMNMQEVRERLETTRSKTGAYPASLAEVTAPGSVEAACPLTSTPYAYEFRGSDYYLACPNPGRHGVGHLSATSTSVPRTTGE